MPPLVWLGLGLAIIVVLLIARAPMFIAFVAGVLPLFLGYANIQSSALGTMAIDAVDSHILIAIPLFILLGNIMGESGGAAALFDFVRTFGGFKAGLGVSAIWACALFGLMCGSTVATALAIGTVVTPELLKNGYTRAHSAAITGVSGCLGIIIPPSIAMIILGEILDVSVGDLFMAGLVPGVLAVLLLSAACYFVVRRDPAIVVERRSTWKQRSSALVRALPTFIIPACILGTIYLGIATPTESAAIAVLAAILVGFLFYRGLNWQKVKHATLEAAISTGAIYCVVFAAVLFGRILGYMRIPQTIAEGLVSLNVGGTEFIILFFLLFFVFGMFFDAIALYFICLPPFLATLHLFNYDMIWFGIVFVFIIMIGQVTPPVGITLYAAASASKASSTEVVRRAVPYLLAQCVSCLLIIIFPAIIIRFG